LIFLFYLYLRFFLFHTIFLDLSSLAARRKEKRGERKLAKEREQGKWEKLRLREVRRGAKN
jgi:hypothetical protein